MKTKDSIIIIQKFFKTIPVERVYLFGSRSRNEETENSDIDLLAYFLKDVNLLEIVRYKRLLEKELDIPVDLLTPESVSERIFPFIQKDMRLIYESTR
jgi:uncharacterized protein